MNWDSVDAIELATVGVSSELARDDIEAVERLDGIDDLSGHLFRAHSVYAHFEKGGVECVADCWDQGVARVIAAALAKYLRVEWTDFSVEMAQPSDPEGWIPANPNAPSPELKEALEDLYGKEGE